MSAQQESPANTATVEKKPLRGKKTKPTNCAFSNARIRRKNWYYLNGQYFANKSNAKQQMQKIQDEKAKVQTEAAEKAAKAAEAESQEKTPS